MNEHPPNSTTSLTEGELDGRLDSWKKIASYLKRDVSTVQRWERRESMPVHRHLHDKLGSVYAYRPEIDQWWASRAVRLAPETSEGVEPGAPANPTPLADAWTSLPSPRRVMWAGAALAFAALVGFWLLSRTDFLWTNPLANAQFRPLTDFEGTENSATISRDGTQVVFPADRDGQMMFGDACRSGRFNLTKRCANR